MRVSAISSDPCDHWAIIRAKELATPDVTTALLINPTATRRMAVMVAVFMPMRSASQIFFGVILLGVNQLVTISVAMAKQAA